MVFDSWYDSYRGAVVLVRVVDGTLRIDGAKRWTTYAQRFGNPVVDTTIRDVSFYVFRLPILLTIQQQGFLISLVALIGCAAGLPQQGRLQRQPQCRVGAPATARPDAKKNSSNIASGTRCSGGFYRWGATARNAPMAAPGSRLG